MAVHRTSDIISPVITCIEQPNRFTSVIQIVRTAARQLIGADGVTFVMGDGDQCHYVEEDAIAPLWKGQRFPMSQCVSGWVMQNGTPAIIPDIFDDPRVPVDAYRPTFVRSLAMVPFGDGAPIGAIGAYWATKHGATLSQIETLLALADSAAITLTDKGEPESPTRRCP